MPRLEGVYSWSFNALELEIVKPVALSHGRVVGLIVDNNSKDMMQRYAITCDNHEQYEQSGEVGDRGFVWNMTIEDLLSG